VLVHDVEETRPATWNAFTKDDYRSNVNDRFKTEVTWTTSLEYVP
jgi:hypothetical protein